MEFNEHTIVEAEICGSLIFEKDWHHGEVMFSGKMTIGQYEKVLELLKSFTNEPNLSTSEHKSTPVPKELL